MKRLLIFIFPLSLGLFGCGEVSTIQSEELSQKFAAEKILQESQSSEKSSRIEDKDIRFICDDGSAYTSFYSGASSATSEAYASRLLMYRDDELLLELQRPSMLKHSGQIFEFLFEASRFSSSYRTDELFQSSLFLGSIDLKTRASKTVELGALPPRDPGLISKEKTLGYTLTSYGISSEKDHLILPTENSYTLKNIHSSEVEILNLDCSPEICANPDFHSASDLISLEKYSTKDNSLNVSLYHYNRDLEVLEEIDLGVSEESWAAAFIDSQILVWIEQFENEVRLVQYNHETHQKTYLLRRQTNSETQEFYAWSKALQNNDLAMMSWSETGQLEIDLSFADSPKTPPRKFSFDFSSLLESGESLQIFSFQLISSSSALVSLNSLTGPRLIKLDLRNPASNFSLVTRSSCAHFSVIAREG